MSFFDAVTQWDYTILQSIQSIQNNFLDVVMRIFSYIGEMGAIWVFIALIMICCKKTRAMGVMVLCAMLAGVLLNEVAIKNVVCRPRPFVTFPDISVNVKPPQSFGFPSGHSCSSFAATTILMLRDKRFGIPALSIAMLIVFSRMYNGVHYPTDVLTGILLGILLGVLTVIIFKKTKLENKLSKPIMYKRSPADDVKTDAE